MPGVSGNKSLSAPVETVKESEIIEPVEEPAAEPAIASEANVTPEINNVIPSEAKNLAEANTELETDLAVADEANTEPDADETTIEPEIIEPVETVKEPEIIEPVEEPAAEPAIASEANVTHETNNVIPSEAKNLAEANAEPETELTVADEAADEPVADETTIEPSVIPSEAKNLAEANTEPNTDETTTEPEIIEPAAVPVERQSETAEESVSIIDDELMRFKAATEGFDRLEKFTFKIFKDVFDNYSGVFVTARQTLADLLLFIAAKCKNAGKIEDFKRAFNIDKDFGKLNQSAANYIPVLLGLTLKLKAQSDFVSGVFNEIRGILLNIICDETAVEFELKILKQLLF